MTSRRPPEQSEVDELLDAFAKRYERAGYSNPYVVAASQVYRWMAKRLDNGDDTRTLEFVAKRWAAKSRAARGKK